MLILLQIIGGVCGIVSLVCFILVIVQMFRHGKTGMGIACLLLLLLCGLGGLVAFIYGWMNANEWRITNIMSIWTGCIIIGLLCNGVVYTNAAMHGIPSPPQIQ